MVVLVTGCRSGIGLATAVHLAARGHTVYAGLRDLATAGQLEQAAAGASVHPVQLDITRNDEREAVVESILSRHGRLDALVNNAGIGVGGFLELIDEDELRRVVDVNLFGTFSLTKLVLPIMRAQASGTVVMVSSMAGRMALPGLGAYAASKFALEGMSEAWRHELSPFGVRVVLVEPGAYRTDIWDRNRTMARRAYEEGPYAAPIARLEALWMRVAARQARDPIEVAELIERLLRSRRPALRHPIGADARLRSMLLRVLPFRVVEKLIARAASRG